MANDTPTQTICPRGHGKVNAHGMPEKSCDTCGGTGIVPVEDRSRGADLYE
jgi:DnaJ-class molecular chaperone